MVEPNFKWTGGSSAAKDTCIVNCGDEFKLGTEQCDDENILNGDGWSSTWLIEAKYSWSGGSLTSKDVWAPVWGDGFRISPDLWDDGNLNNGDEWSSTLIIEPNYKCTGGTISASKSRQVILAQTFKHLIISLFKSAFISIFARNLFKAILHNIWIESLNWYSIWVYA